VNSLAPSLLLSMPQLLDPNFNRTVVLLCRHGEEGAFGLVVNRPAVTTGRLVIGGDPPVSVEGEIGVWVGGPVDRERSWILVGTEPDDEEGQGGLHIANGLHLSTSPGRLKRLFDPQPPPRTRLVVGHSGWAPGQLEAELEASAWLLGEVDSELIFGTRPEEMWEAAIRRLGVDPGALHMSRGVH
jgi:putative transcriptional regulator